MGNSGSRWSWLVFSIPSPLQKKRFPKMIIHHSSPLSIRGQRRRWQTQVPRQWGGQFFFTPDHFGIIGFTSIIVVNTLCSVQTVLKCAFFWLHPWVWFGSISSLFVEKKHPNDVSNFQAKLFFLTNADMCLFVGAIGCKPFPPWNINFQNIKLFPTNLRGCSYIT